MKTFFYLILIAVFGSGCAVHSGMMTGNACLGNNHFKMTGTAVGKASAHYFLGIGGLDPQGLVLQAKTDLMNNAQLKPEQALANVTVDFKRSYFLIYSTTRVTITADIADFNEQATVSDTLQNNDKNSDKHLYGFKIGEKVEFYTGPTEYVGTIKELKEESAVIEYKDYDSGAISTVEKSFRKMYKIKQDTANGLKDVKHLNQFNVGENVEFYIGAALFEGTIKELKQDSAVIEYKDHNSGAASFVEKPLHKIYKIKQK